MQTMQTKERQEVERRICRQVIKSMLAQGFNLSVFNGQRQISKSKDEEAILQAMFSTDEECMDVYCDNHYIGCVVFIYGNTGFDVICNYSTSLEAYMQEANDLADSLHLSGVRFIPHH